jgi:tetratricopeptide (TPR) repeat protein
LVGASGAIAAITTAYLALFPRSHVIVLIWFFIIHMVEVPAMILIGLKIIVWDNIMAPGIGGQGNVAHAAHLAGYLFGFVGAMFMLLIRALPRDQFDLLALWKRWHRRRAFSEADVTGQVARPVPRDPAVRAAEEKQLDDVAARRQEIHDALAARDLLKAAHSYKELINLDPQQCLSEFAQLDVARQLYQSGRFADAAAAFQRFIDCYPMSREADNARLFLGILYARDLNDPGNAERVLREAVEKLRDDERRAQGLQWLERVRAIKS